MPRLLGRTSSNVGRYSGLCAGGPNYNKRFNRFLVPRLLYHSGLDEVIRYPYVPNRTVNFSYDILPAAKFAHQETLSSNITQQWQAVHNDVIVREIYNSGISHSWEFIHNLYRFWTTLMDVGEFGLWRPLDLTDKIYRMRVVKITIGGQEIDATYVGISRTEKWVTQELQVHLKLMPTFPPNATIFASGPTIQAVATGTGTGT